jgi:hypothetical protein
LIVLCLGLTTVILASCGQTYEVKSIAVTPGVLAASGNEQITLVGIGAYQQLTVTAIYSNGKTRDVTQSSGTTYQINSSIMPAALNPAVAVPLQNVSLSTSGLVSVRSEACTFDTEPNPGSNDTAWTYFGYPYKGLITYTNNGVAVTALLDIEVVNSRWCFDGNNATPFTGFAGNLADGWGS